MSFFTNNGRHWDWLASFRQLKDLGLWFLDVDFPTVVYLFKQKRGLVKSLRSFRENCRDQFQTLLRQKWLFGSWVNIASVRLLWLLNKKVSNKLIWQLSQREVRYVSENSNTIGHCSDSCHTQSRKSKNMGDWKKKRKHQITDYKIHAYTKLDFRIYYLFNDQLATLWCLITK